MAKKATSPKRKVAKGAKRKREVAATKTPKSRAKASPAPSTSKARKGPLTAEPPPTPRIKKILVRGFRAFPGNEDYDFNLTSKGKNLLLYGENGSGKSSLFKALGLLLQSQDPGFPFDTNKNVFWQAPGVIRLELTAGTPADFQWSPTDAHPAVDEGASFKDLVRRSTMLTYRDLLRTSIEHEDRDRIDLYDLITGTLLAGFELANGRSVLENRLELQLRQALGAGAVKNRIAAMQYEKDEDGTYDREEEIFQDALIEDIGDYHAQLSELLTGNQGLFERATRILERLDEELSLTFAIQAWQDKQVRLPSKAFDGPARRLGMFLECQYHGYDIQHPGLFLNEARLTAVALSIYLAAAEMCTPHGPGQPRLLVLDDVLIGLDMSHRLPVLQLLRDRFKDWQVFLFTHDRVWYDIAQLNLEPSEWACYKMFELQPEEGKPARPVKRPGLSYLEQAEAHLANGYSTEAAVNARAGFEEVLRDGCEDYRVQLDYQRDPIKVTADDLWTALKKKAQAPDSGLALEHDLIKDVEAMRSKILNQLSHAGPPGLGKVEALFAIQVVKRLKTGLSKKSKRVG